MNAKFPNVFEKKFENKFLRVKQNLPKIPDYNQTLKAYNVQNQDLKPMVSTERNEAQKIGKNISDLY